MAKKKVAVIGAGPAGLTAGYELLKSHADMFDVTIFEKDAVVGGISRTVEHHGNRMDIGGHRFFSKNKRVNEWWQELMSPQSAPAYDDRKIGRHDFAGKCGGDPETSDNVFLKRRRVSRIYYKNKFFDYPIKMSLKTLRRIGPELPAVIFSYAKSLLAKRDESSLEDFFINRFGQKLYSMFFEGYTQKLWGVHPSRLSAEWGSQRVKGLSVVEILRNAISGSSGETSLIEEFHYPKYGPGQMWQIAANRFVRMGGYLMMNTRITGLVEEENGRISSVRYSSDEGTSSLDADYVISSMPIPELCSALSAPEEIASIASGLPFRDFVTVGLLVDRLAVSNTTKMKTMNGIIPDCWIYVQNDSVKVGRVQIFNNWSPYMVKNPESTVWVGMEYFCNETGKDWSLSDAQWTDLARKELEKIGLIGRNCVVMDSHVERMPKAYPAYFGSYCHLGKIRDYLDTKKNLFCVGRNGQHRYNNMDHSMITAFEAVSDIVFNKTDKSSLWSVNTENDYHEGLRS